MRTFILRLRDDNACHQAVNPGPLTHALQRGGRVQQLWGLGLLLVVSFTLAAPYCCLHLRDPNARRKLGVLSRLVSTCYCMPQLRVPGDANAPQLSSCLPEDPAQTCC